MTTDGDHPPRSATHRLLCSRMTTPEPLRPIESETHAERGRIISRRVPSGATHAAACHNRRRRRKRRSQKPSRSRKCSGSPCFSLKDNPAMVAIREKLGNGSLHVEHLAGLELHGHRRPQLDSKVVVVAMHGNVGKPLDALCAVAALNGESLLTNMRQNFHGEQRAL
eukprot:Amastigsp_a761_82.p3 type:complete len:167 gc:universal Amastigsp_a761_82:520-20(-)